MHMHMALGQRIVDSALSRLPESSNFKVEGSDLKAVWRCIHANSPNV